MNIRRGPSRSTARPPKSINAPSPTEYALTTHCTDEGVNPSACSMPGAQA
jgi:hypothetical protein